MTVYRAKRNVALPGGVWKQNTDRELDPASELARTLLAAGRIAPVGSALVEELRPASQAPTYQDAVAASLTDQAGDDDPELEPTDDDLGGQDQGDGTEAQAHLVPDDDRPVDPGPYAAPTAPRLIAE